MGGFTECGAGTGVVVAPVEWSFEQERPLNGVTLGDCDDDGLPEAVVFNYAAPARLYRNLGGFRFHDVTLGSGIETLNRATNAAFGDLDGDGRLDLVMTEGLDAVVSGAPPPSVLEGAVRVFRGAGACRFTEVTSAWGFEPVRTAGLAFPSGVDLADVDADGRLDVLVRMLPERVSRTILYMSRPDGRWVDATAEVLGPVPGSAWAALFTDTDGDMQPDLFLLLTGGDGGPPARFLRREGPAWPPHFREAIPVSSLFGPEDDGQRKLMGGASGDFDGDGALDVFLTDIGAQHLLRRVGDNAYEDVAFQAGVAASRLPDGGRTVAFGASLLDYDNDGWPDLAFVTSTDQADKAPPFPFLFHNRGGGTFEDRTYLLGAQESRDERGLSVADLDRDGRLDLWCGGHGEPPRILRNTVPSGASFSVRLRGHTSNREGVGSVVRARLGGRVLVQEMGASGSAYGSGERRLLFGIGSADHAESVEVHWPSGFVQQAGPVRAGQDLVVEEPALLQVQPPVLTRGATAQIIINPPGGGAAGHLVELVLEPEAQTVPVTSVGNGTYVARVAPTPGLHAVRATIDGLSLRARPQLLVR